MAINDKTDLTVAGYSRSQRPVVTENITKYTIDELQRIERSLDSLVRAAIQVADQEPENPQKGMVRYNLSGWDALGDGSTGLVVYNGTSWVAV